MSDNRDQIKTAYAKREEKSGWYTFFNAGHVFIEQAREAAILGKLKKNAVESLKGKKILEIGCGTGSRLLDFLRWGATPNMIAGVDILEDRVAAARRCLPRALMVQAGDASRLGFAGKSFDIILQSTVFSSILSHDTRVQVAGEMDRVLKDNGIVLWYDFMVNNPFNKDVAGIPKKEIKTLFPGYGLDLAKIIPPPFIIRKIAGFSWGMCYLLNKLKIFNTFYAGILSPNRVTQK